MLVILPSSFLIAPKKAEAVVPVIDAALIALFGEYNVAWTTWAAQNKLTTDAVAWNTGNQVNKNIGPIGLGPMGLPISPIGAATSILSWDSIAYMSGKVLLSALTNSVIDWINSGFEGNPLFITDFGMYMQDAADQATGQFFKEFLSPEVYNAICSPFRAQLHLALKSRYTYAYRMRCTLSTVIGNTTDFSNSLRGGDWGQWMSISLNPQNDPNMALLASLDELSARQSAAVNRAQTESIFNAGFLGMKKCVEYYTDEWTGGQMCIRYENTSPGKWVSDELSSATGIEFQRLGLADDLNKILASLIFQLFSQLTQGIRR